MATFRPGVPVKTDKPEIVVDAGLKPGAHRFRLVVINARGKESAPDEVTVDVTAGIVPTVPRVVSVAGENARGLPSRGSRKSRSRQ